MVGTGQGEESFFQISYLPHMWFITSWVGWANCVLEGGKFGMPQKECSSWFLIWSQDYFLWSLFHSFSEAFVHSYTHSFNKQYIFKKMKTSLLQNSFDFPGVGKRIWVTCELLLMSSSGKASEVAQIYLFSMWLPRGAVPSSEDPPHQCCPLGSLASPRRGANGPREVQHHGMEIHVDLSWWSYSAWLGVLSCWFVVVTWGSQASTWKGLQGWVCWTLL